MLVGEIMTSPAFTVRDDARPEVAVHLLAKERLTMLPVVDAENHLVGVVSEADLLGLPEPPDPRAHLRPVSFASPERGPASVADLISGPPQTTSEHADVADVAELFHRTAWKCLPVMRDQQLVGVVSRSDIIRAMSRDDDVIEEDVNRLLKDLEPAWEATVTDGIVTITGPGPDRAAEAAASLAATVAGVRKVHRAVHMVEHDDSDRPSSRTSAAAPPAWPVKGWVCPPSSGSAVDEL